MHTYAYLPPHPQIPPNRQDTGLRHGMQHYLGKQKLIFHLYTPPWETHILGEKNKKPLNKYAPKVKACVDGGRHLPIRKTNLGVPWFQAAMMRSRQTQLKSSWEAVPHPGAVPRPEREPLERFNPKFMVTAHKSVSSFCRSHGWSSPLGGFSHTDLWLQGFTQATNNDLNDLVNHERTT